MFYFTFRYHLGSLAFGSLLIAIVQIVRVILEYVDSKLNGSENRIAKFLLKLVHILFHTNFCDLVLTRSLFMGIL